MKSIKQYSLSGCSVGITDKKVKKKSNAIPVTGREGP
jgi:hypothetical protein